MPQAEQIAIRDEIHAAIADLASVELDIKIGGMQLDTFVNLEPFREHLLDRFEIWMNDTTPSPYTEKIAPLNLIYLKLCRSVENVGYVRGRLKAVESVGARYAASFEGGTEMEFERVATRFGTRHDDNTSRMIGPAPRRLHYGDWLLEFPLTERMEERDDGVSRVRRVNAARDALVRGVARLFQTPLSGQGAKTMLSKESYESGMSLRETGYFASDPKMADPEKWLSDRLRLGRRVTYDRRVEF